MVVTKDKVRNYLIEMAKKGDVIYYSDLYQHFGYKTGPKRTNPIPSILGQLMVEDNSKGQPLLPSIVVSKKLDSPRVGLVPQPAFFNSLCAIRELPTPNKIADKRQLHQKERDAVFAYYAAGVPDIV